MDDGVDVRRLRVEDLCGLNTSMNTIGLRKQQPFGCSERFKTILQNSFLKNHLLFKCANSMVERQFFINYIFLRRLLIVSV